MPNPKPEVILVQSCEHSKKRSVSQLSLSVVSVFYTIPAAPCTLTGHGFRSLMPSSCMVSYPIREARAPKGRHRLRRLRLYSIFRSHIKPNRCRSRCFAGPSIIVSCDHSMVPIDALQRMIDTKTLRGREMPRQQSVPLFWHSRSIPNPLS